MSSFGIRCHRPFTILRKTNIALTLAVFLGLTVPAHAQTYISLHSFNGQTGGKLPYTGVTLGPGGVLYGTTSEGGPVDCGTVYRLAHRGSGWVLTPLYTFKGGSDGCSPYGGITFGPGGYMYGTTANGGDGDHGTVFRMSAPAGVCFTTQCPWPETVLYRFKGGSDGAYPVFSDLVFDQAGNLYGTTDGDATGDAGTVFELSPSGGSWTETILYSFTHAEQPYAGITFDSAGNLFGTTSAGGIMTGECQGFQYGCGTVYELSPSGSGWVEKTLYEFTAGSDGAGPAGGVAIDPAGNVYGTTSYNGGTVWELQRSGGGWTFSTLYSFDVIGGPLDKPTLDAAGNLYGTVLDEDGYFAGLVYKLTRSGSGWTEKDLVDFGNGENDGEFPYGSVVLDANGNVYGTTLLGGSQGNGNVWEITP
jgi:uncharacterized repeat protein (TIGR03803 family)